MSSTTIKVPTDAYCVIEDVYQHLPGRKYDANTRPTFQQAEELTKRVADEINAQLRALGYSPPLTDTSDKNLLKEINAIGSAFKCESATLAVIPNRDTSILDTLKDEWGRMMEALRTGAYQFSGAGAPDTRDADVNDDLDDDGDREDPIFKMDMDDQEF